MTAFKSRDIPISRINISTSTCTCTIITTITMVVSIIITMPGTPIIIIISLCFPIISSNIPITGITVRLYFSPAEVQLKYLDPF